MSLTSQNKLQVTSHWKQKKKDPIHFIGSLLSIKQAKLESFNIWILNILTKFSNCIALINSLNVK